MSSSGALTLWHEPLTSYQSVSTSVSMEDDTWHLIYAVIRGTGTNTATTQIFVDGGLFTQSSSSGTVTSANFIGSSTSMTNYGIGNVKLNSWGTPHLGDIGPHYIYAKELSVAEQQQNYYALIDRFNF